MTDIFRVRIERKLLAKTSRVAEQMGTTPGEIVRLLFTQVVKRKRIPFSVSAGNDRDELVDVGRRNRVLRGLDDSEGW
jgi:addiction module RelB/DinJ family antitoxin